MAAKRRVEMNPAWFNPYSDEVPEDTVTVHGFTGISEGAGWPRR
jgi:hypothetical protein